MADIVVVEDDKDLAWTFSLLLSTEGHTVRVANDGESAMQLFAACLPDLVITDIEMPKLDGPGMAYRMLIEDCGKDLIPIVVISGFPALESVAGRIGTPYYVAKPFEVGAVLALVKRALAERVPPRPLKKAC